MFRDESQPRVTRSYICAARVVLLFYVGKGPAKTVVERGVITRSCHASAVLPSLYFDARE